MQILTTVLKCKSLTLWSCKMNCLKVFPCQKQRSRSLWPKLWNKWKNAKFSIPWSLEFPWSCKSVFFSATLSFKLLDCANNVTVRISTEKNFSLLTSTTEPVVSSYELKTFTKWQLSSVLLHPWIQITIQKTVSIYSHDFSDFCLLYGW